MSAQLAQAIGSSFRQIPGSGILVTANSSVSGGEPPATGNLYDLTTVNNPAMSWNGQSRTPPTWVTDGTFQWPNEPTTNTQTTVTTMSALQAAVQQSNIQITIPASFGTQAGSLNMTGSNVDVIMSNLATINVTGDFDLVNANTWRWTGGNVISSARIRLRGTDMIFDDFYARSTGDTGNFSGAVRLALLNSTIAQSPETNNSWAVYTLPTTTQNNWIFANVKLTSTGQNNRFQNVDNLILIDSVFNPDAGSANSMRLHKEIDNMWLADVELGQGGFLNTADTGYAYSLDNATFERFVVHTSLRAIVTDSDQINSTIRDSISRTTNTNDISGTPALGNFQNLGGNVHEAWNGTTYPDYSGIGAQR